MAPQPKVFRNLKQPLSEDLLKPDKYNVIKLSAIDKRLSDVRIDNSRYPEFRDGRPSCAIDTDKKAWVCKCRIAGIVYNSAPTKCGYCHALKPEVEDCTVPWGLPESRKKAWVLQRIEAHEQQPTSLHLPPDSRNRMTGQNGAQKSGVFFAILRALGFDWDTAYRTAYQAIVWDGKGNSRKMEKIVYLLIDSKELKEIRYEAQQVLKGIPLVAPAEDMQTDGEDAEYDAEDEEDEVDDNDDDAIQQDSDEDEDMFEDLDYNLDEDHDAMDQDEAEHPSNTVVEQLDNILDADRNQVVPATATAVVRFISWRSANLHHLFDAGIKEPFNAEPDTIKDTLFQTLGQQLDQAKHVVALRLLRENDEFLTDIRLAHTSAWPVRKEVRDRRHQDGPDLLRGLPTIGGMNS